MAGGAFSGHGAVTEVRVEGLRELNRAFREVSKDLGKGMREALEASGDPVKTAAQTLTVQRVARVGIPWSRMRVGVTKVSVYVAPVERGVKSKTRAKLRRPDFKNVLLDRGLDPALEQNKERVAQEFEDALTDLAKAWARV